MSQKVNMIINFLDGTKVSYYFPKQIKDDSTMTSRVKSILENPYIIIEDDGILTLFPTHNIKSIQLNPAPDTLPDFVIQDARLVKTF